MSLTCPRYDRRIQSRGATMDLTWEIFQPYVALVGALVLSFPIAWNRECHGGLIGVRTFPLVAVGSCAFMLLGLYFIDGPAPDAKARLLQGLMTGIGFVGGGAILKTDDSVSGTASAASIWIVGAIGAATALGAWGYAIALAFINWVVLRAFVRLKQKSDDSRES